MVLLAEEEEKTVRASEHGTPSIFFILRTIRKYHNHLEPVI
jgi:hypothetical protein